MKDTFKFGGGGETFVHPAIMVALLVAAIVMFSVRRERVVYPLFFAYILIPFRQMVLVGPFHFSMLRIVILLSVIRVCTAKLFSPSDKLLSGGRNAIDKALVFAVAVGATAFVLLWQEWGAVINQLGMIYTVLGIYFPLRFLIRDEEDVRRSIKAMAYVSFVTAVLMIAEQITGRSMYSFVGETIAFRDEHFRAAGPFVHPIYAGVFGATGLALFVAIRHCGARYKKIGLVGILSATAIVLASNSSTPVLAYGAALLGLMMWPLRKQMRMIRWGIVILLVTLHLVMKAPVWALIQRVDVMGSSSGYHRYQLVDQCIRHFADWWLIGTKDNATWGYDMWDQSNQYVAVAENSGLLALCAFLAVIVYAFKYVARARNAVAGNKEQEEFMWILGVALFAHCVGFFGASYWDQLQVSWYVLLAMVGTIAASTSSALQGKERGLASGVARAPFDNSPSARIEAVVPQ